MSVTESERHQVIQWFQEQMGPEGGELMILGGGSVLAGLGTALVHLLG